MTTPVRLTDMEIQQRLSVLDGWSLKGVQITRQYHFKDFAEAMRFVNRVAEMAESANHHPDIFILYSRVMLFLSTHSAGGLTEKDFTLATAIDDR